MLTPLSRLGSPQTLLGVAPGAGNQFTITIPKQQIFRPQFLHFQLTTDANVGNRYAGITFNDAAGLNYNITPETAIVASTVIQVSGVSGLGIDSHLTSTTLMYSLPSEFYLLGDTDIVSQVDGIQVGDVIENIRLFGSFWAQTTDLS